MDNQEFGCYAPDEYRADDVRMTAQDLMELLADMPETVRRIAIITVVDEHGCWYPVSRSTIEFDDDSFEVRIKEDIGA